LQNKILKFNQNLYLAMEIKKVDYFKITINSNAGAAYKLLSIFSEFGISLLAFKANPLGQGQTEFSLFPNDSAKMKAAAKNAGLNLNGPHAALIIKSNNDEPGECAGIFDRLSKANITLQESIGIADIMDSYGVVVCLDQKDCEKAKLILME
jgi:hypothetical protein